MLRPITILILIFFIVSCENDKALNKIKLSTLIEPNFTHNLDLFNCSLNKDLSLISLESFFSNNSNKYSILTKSDKLTVSVLFPENTTSVKNFLISVSSKANHIGVKNFIDEIKSDGFDNIANCSFAIYQNKALDLISNLDLLNKNDFINIEILRCSYNDGYNFGTFQISVNRFINNIKKLDSAYSISFVEDNSFNNDFVWINSFYDRGYQSNLIKNWINQKDAIEIKDEFNENATCTDAKKYKGYNLF